MKILNKIWGVSFLVLLLIVAAPHRSKAQGEYISEQDFYDELAPYGTWVYDPQYGDVWVPDADPGFSPYRTRGHWVLTSYGNTWVSDYPWGWATFHYGRWRYDDFYGWEWIPGYEWAPAWVSWRHGGGYYGWAPLMPGISISLSFGSGYRVPNSYWAFAPEAYITRPNIYNYYVPSTRVVNIIRNTAIINNTYVNGGRQYIAGPRAADIQRYTHQRPRIYSINNAARPGTMSVQNNTVNIFRPAVRRTPDARPARVVDGNAYKQQNPDQPIARRGPGGAVGFNHDNASKLATLARNANDNNVVRVNNRPDNGQQARRPDQDNRRDNSAQPAQEQSGQQPKFNRGSGRGDNRSNNDQHNSIQQKQDQITGEQKAIRQQRRDEYRHQELQQQTQPPIIGAPAINGQTPLQQQQEAIRGQRRQLERQQAQQEQARRQQQQQAQQVQQQQAQQVQQQQVQQQQQAQREQERAQREQQRQAAQQAQQQAAQQRGAQQAAQQQQAQQAQREQRQAQQEAQQAQREQQRQAQQQAQQAQREQQRGQQQQQQQEQRRPPGKRPN